MDWHREDWRREERHKVLEEYGRGAERRASLDVEELGLCNPSAHEERELRSPYGKNFESLYPGVDHCSMDQGRHCLMRRLKDGLKIHMASKYITYNFPCAVFSLTMIGIVLCVLCRRKM